MFKKQRTTNGHLPQEKIGWICQGLLAVVGEAEEQEKENRAEVPQQFGGWWGGTA